MKSAATLSIDLDNLWAYQRTQGLEAWRNYDSFHHIAIPRFLQLSSELDLLCTVFVIGRDLELPQTAELVARCASSGHEIGNHSFDHRIDLHRFEPMALTEDFARAEQALEKVTGARPRGFRGPAFTSSENILSTLIERDYWYDASTLPASTGPIARLWHRRSRIRTSSSQEANTELFGSWRDAAQSLKPYYWRNDAGQVLELPVTTMPGLRLPVHLTYLQFIADRSEAVAFAYFDVAMKLCQMRGVQPSLLLHASDFIGADDPLCPEFLPGMERPWSRKAKFLERILEAYQRQFEVITLEKMCHRLMAEKLPVHTIGQG